jgi:hypothetical protein
MWVLSLVALSLVALSLVALSLVALSIVVYGYCLHRLFESDPFGLFLLESFIELLDSKKYLSYYMDPRIIYSLQSALLFFIIASPQVYAITGKLFSTKGTPLLVIHSIVYGVLVYALMLINA